MVATFNLIPPPPEPSLPPAKINIIGQVQGPRLKNKIPFLLPDHQADISLYKNVLTELPPFFESSFCVKSLSVEVFMCFVV